MAGPQKPVALITVFSTAVLQRILDAIAAGPKPPVADWYVGTYGLNGVDAKAVARVPGCRYAPVFAIQPQSSLQVRKRRRVSKEEAALIHDPAHAGEIPGSSANRVIPPRDVRAWGIELGRRFRDQLRTQRSRGISIETWQFDEILTQCGSSGSHREFVGGALRGLAEGRPELGDKLEKGFVWSSRLATAALPGLPFAGDVKQLWQDIDRAALFFVGEEYPPFTGAPGNAGSTFSAGHRALLQQPGVRRGLGQRYIVGMTPGWRLAPGLGGNVAGKSPADVTSWRNGFIDARIASRRPSGYAQFNFANENARPNRVEDAVRSLHRACRQHGQ